MDNSDCPYLDGRCTFFSIMVKKNEKLAESIKRLYSENLYKKCRRYQLYEAGMPVPDDFWPSGPKPE